MRKIELSDADHAVLQRLAEACRALGLGEAATTGFWLLSA